MYAVLTKIVDPKFPCRPLSGVKIDPYTWQAFNPQTCVLSNHPDKEVLVLGEWTENSEFRLGDHEATWAQYAAHQLGQVLRQNELAARLREIGIDREDEPYVLTEESPVWKYQFTFTFDELDLLLRAAEQQK